MDYERHAQDVSNAPIQDAIGQSLLGPEFESDTPEETPEGDSLFSDSVALLDQAVDEQATDVVRYGDGAENFRAPRRSKEDAEPQDGQEAGPQENAAQPEQAQAQTPEEQIEYLNDAVEQFELNDPPAAREFASDFCAALGTDIYASGVNVELLGATASKTVFSALGVYQASGGDFSRVPDVSPQAAKAYAHELLPALGIDPRVARYDEMLLARTAFRGMWNFIDTYAKAGGRVTDVTKLNTPEAAEWAYTNFLRALGSQGEPPRTSEFRMAALRFADTMGKKVLSVLGKLQSREKAPTGRARSSRGSGQRVRGGAKNFGRTEFAPRFKSNNDIFPASVVDAATVKNL